MKRRIVGTMIICLLCALITQLTGCRDKEDVVIEPQVQLLNPAENTVYNIYDSILVSAVVNHKSTIVKVTVSVTDDDLKPILQGYTKTVNENQTTINISIKIDNRYIAGDQQYLLIEVEDSKNTFKFWYSIHINPLERELEKVTFVSGNANENSLYILKAPNSAEKIAAWSSDYLGGDIDSRNLMFYTSGSSIDGLRAYDLVENNLSWSISVLPPASMPYFTALSHNDGKLIIGRRDGFVDTYDHTGQKTFTGSEVSNGTFSKLLKHEGYILGAFEPYTGNINKLIVFNYPAGNIFQTIEMEADPVAILSLKDKEVLYLCSQAGIVKAYVYTPAEKSFNYLHVVTNHDITAATGSNNNFFLLSGDTVHWYRPDIGSTVPCVVGEGITCIEYDPVNNALFIGQQGMVKQYILPALTEQVIYNGSDPVKDINLWYNK